MPCRLSGPRIFFINWSVFSKPSMSFRLQRQMSTAFHALGGASLSRDHLCGSLPAALRRPEMTLHSFKRQLKAYLFHIWCSGEQKEHSPPPGAVVTFSWFRCRIQNCRLTYLLTHSLSQCVCVRDVRCRQSRYRTRPRPWPLACCVVNLENGYCLLILAYTIYVKVGLL